MNRATSLVELPLFAGYSYGYPHKLAYRPFDPPLGLEQVWAGEPRGALFLYLHVPFCEYRCGFCNLFTLAQPEENLTAAYLAQLSCEAQVVRDAIGDAQFARVAIGGGTPTFLHEQELEQLFETLATMRGGDSRRLPTSCEASPATVSAAKLQLLKDLGVSRLSLGVQSFQADQTRALGRPQASAAVFAAIDQAIATGFDTLSLDLIYGAPGQTSSDWLEDVKRALSFSPDEFYLYPLYVRQLTGLGKHHTEAGDNRLECYREARQMLLDHGYRQSSLRMFFKSSGPPNQGPVYCCQSDNMIGLGCGARSYTQQVHYSREFAVAQSGVWKILQDYLHSERADFAVARHGFRLDSEEQRRRFVIVSLLQSEGLSMMAYRKQFSSSCWDDLPQLAELHELGWADVTADRLRLTAEGLEHSDSIGPWLYSAEVSCLMEETSCR